MAEINDELGSLAASDYDKRPSELREEVLGKLDEERDKFELDRLITM